MYSMCQFLGHPVGRPLQGISGAVQCKIKSK